MSSPDEQKTSAHFSRRTFLIKAGAASVARRGWVPTHFAPARMARCCSSEWRRTPSRSSAAGLHKLDKLGHWFEPSSAHLLARPSLGRRFGAGEARRCSMIQ
jgi:hypothetical protein